MYGKDNFRRGRVYRAKNLSILHLNNAQTFFIRAFHCLLLFTFATITIL